MARATARGVRAGFAYVELGVDGAQFVKDLESASNRLKSFGAEVAKIGAGVASVGAALSAPFTAATLAFSSTSSDLRKLQTETGLSIDKIVALQHAVRRGSDDIAAMAQEAADLRLIPSGAAIADAVRLTGSMVRLSESIRMVAFELGAAVANDFADFFDQVHPIVTGIIQWIRENQKLVRTISSIAFIVAGAGIAITVMGAQIAAIGVVVGVAAKAIITMGVALLALTTPLGVAGVAVMSLAAIIVRYTAEGQRAISDLVGGFRWLSDMAVESFRAISNALNAGDVRAAVEVFWAAILVAWQSGVHQIETTWAGMRVVLVEGVNRAWSQISTIFATGAAGVRIAWITATDGMLTAWRAVTGTMRTVWVELQSSLERGFLRVMSLMDRSFDLSEALKIAEKNRAADDARYDAQRRARIEQANRDRATAIGAADAELMAAMQRIKTAEEESNRAARSKSQTRLDEANARLAEAQERYRKAVETATKLTPMERSPFAAGGSLGVNTQQRLQAAGSFSASELARNVGGDIDRDILNEIKNLLGVTEEQMRIIRRSAERGTPLIWGS